MSESQKGGPSTAGSKQKVPLFDVEIGKEFLSSWKSNTIGEDALDFSSETVPRGKKNAFTLDKLDMDFTFDGGFDKISAFKVDMSDLEFSSPPKKAHKPKEGSGKTSTLGNKEVKERFTFNFDFNELDGFDLDSSLSKGGDKAVKCSADRESDYSVRCVNNHDGGNSLEKDIDVPSEKSDIAELPRLDNISGSNFKLLMGGLGEFETSEKDIALPIPAQGDLHESNDVIDSPAQRTTSSAEEIREEDSTSEQSEMTGSSEPNAPLPIPDSVVQSITGGGSAVETVPELQTGPCISDSEVNTSPVREKDGSVKSMTSSHSMNRSPVILNKLKSLPLRCTLESQNNGGAKEKLIHDKEATFGKWDAVSRVHNLTEHRESKDGNLPQLKDKVAASAHSNFIKKPSDFQVTLASKHISIFHDKKVEVKHLEHTADEESPKSKGSGRQAGNKKIDHSVSHSQTVRKGVHAQGNARNEKDRNPSGFQAGTVHTPEQKTVSGTPKSLISRTNKVSSVTPTLKSKFVSVERRDLSPLKTDKKMCDISSHRLPMKITSSGDPSFSMGQKETKSSSTSGRNVAVDVCMPSEKAQCNTTERTAIHSPSLKRKSVELRTLNPLKRATESPLGSRNSWESHQVKDAKRVLEIENVKDTPKTVNIERPSPMLDVHVEPTVYDLELPALIENDENVEKAEACAKELEDICNMLKKKHEEAKEVLVRAVVNNNLLLMLNHPIYEEKIRVIQRFAANLALKEHQS